MLTIHEAAAAIREAMPTFGTESMPTAQANGRVLRQTVVAERDQPPFDRVTMDGIAIRQADFADGKRSFPIQARQDAGDAALTLDAGNTIEIMTGASLPDGADCIIPVERISIEDGVATLEDGYTCEANQFIHARGSDHTKDTELLRPGNLISPMDIAIIASAGLTDLEVSALPSIRVISTGNELVPAGEPIEDHQIRLSNGPAVIAMLERHGYVNCQHDHIVDDKALLEARVGQHLDEADVLVLSGGVSMGKADYLPEVLKGLGVEVIFHKVKQRPGLPMWFGMGPKDQPVFALPGNPVSTLVCCRQYVINALNLASQRRELPPTFAALAMPVTFKPDLTNFLPVKLACSVGGKTLALPVKTNTSGDFTALSGTDGYVELVQTDSEFPADSPVQLTRW